MAVGETEQLKLAKDWLIELGYEHADFIDNEEKKDGLIFRLLKDEFEIILACQVDGCSVYIDDKNGILNVYGVFEGLFGGEFDILVLSSDQNKRDEFTDRIRTILLSSGKSLCRIEASTKTGCIEEAILWQRMKITEDNPSTFNRFSDCIASYISTVQMIRLEREKFRHKQKR